MTRRILEWTTGRPATVMIIALLIAGLGIWSFVNLQIDVIPDTTGVQVQINTTVPALAPEEIDEHGITAKFDEPDESESDQVVRGRPTLVESVDFEVAHVERLFVGLQGNDYGYDHLERYVRLVVEANVPQYSDE